MIRSVASIVLVAVAIPAFAQQPPPMLTNDPKRPVAAIARDLNVTQEQFVACFENVRPTPGGARPESQARVQTNKQVLLPCLQRANPAITNDKLDAVMDRYRPGGRAAQIPQR
jgi:hypothetical protein